MEARRGRGDERRPILVGTDEPRRVAIVAASGLWRWRFRGGVASDAFTALWGSIFDWLAAERADRRAAVPDERLVRAGDMVRWRRGSANDSVVAIALRRRGSPGVDSLTLRFPAGTTIVETHPLAAGTLRRDHARRRRAAGRQRVARVAAASATRRERADSRRGVVRLGAAPARWRVGMGVRAGDIAVVRGVDSAPPSGHAMISNGD